MRQLRFAVACAAVAVVACQAQAAGPAPDAAPPGAARLSPFAADAASAPLAARADAMRVAQIIPDTAPAEKTTGNPSLPPLKWVGLLVIPTPTDKDPTSIGECTGQFIKPNVVLTAAHCVRDIFESPTGPWPDPTKGTFWLQYQNQQGTPFKILCAETNPLWRLPANYAAMKKEQQIDAQRVAFQHDFAMLLVDGVSPTGAMPYALDWKGSVDYATRVGYAADIFNGQIVQKSGGAVFFADAIPMMSKSYPGIVVQWAPITDLTSGTSGGAWVANFSTEDKAGANELVAVTSFQFLGYPGGEGAAYLTAAEFNPLLADVSNGCKGEAAKPAAPSSGPAPIGGAKPRSGPAPTTGAAPAGGGSNH
jgi:hypothetical protein